MIRIELHIRPVKLLRKVYTTDKTSHFLVYFWVVGVFFQKSRFNSRCSNKRFLCKPFSTFLEFSDHVLSKFY